MKLYYIILEALNISCWGEFPIDPGSKEESPIGLVELDCRSETDTSLPI